MYYVKPIHLRFVLYIFILCVKYTGHAWRGRLTISPPGSPEIDLWAAITPCICSNDGWGKCHAPLEAASTLDAAGFKDPILAKTAAI